jgi:hypothetical protein
MTQPPSNGTCNLCGRNLGRAAMTRHLKACRGPLSEGAPSKPFFHLVIEGGYKPLYWLHVAVRADATLAQLDAFLRETWLECCGHLSAFTIHGQSYMSDTSQFGGGTGMGVRLMRVLAEGVQFTYEYDFGTTTALRLKVAGVREDLPPAKPIFLMARNDPPRWVCEQCSAHPATHICPECACNERGCLCDECLEDHECGPEMILPIVNSPRVGQCCYSG